MVQSQHLTWWHLDRGNFHTWHLEYLFMKIQFLLKYWSQPSITIIQFKCIQIATHGTIKSCHMTYWLNFGKNN